VPKTNAKTGIPAAGKHKAYWLTAAAVGSVAGALTWWALTTADPLGKGKAVVDFGPGILSGMM
jgi:hypothetical protein